LGRSEVVAKKMWRFKVPHFLLLHFLYRVAWRVEQNIVISIKLILMERHFSFIRCFAQVMQRHTKQRH